MFRLVLPPCGSNWNYLKCHPLLRKFVIYWGDAHLNQSLHLPVCLSNTMHPSGKRNIWNISMQSNMFCFCVVILRSGERSAEDPAEAGRVPALPTAWRDRPQQHGRCQGVQSQVPGRGRHDPSWLQPAPQASYCQGTSSTCGQWSHCLWKRNWLFMRS